MSAHIKACDAKDPFLEWQGISTIDCTRSQTSPIALWKSMAAASQPVQVIHQLFQLYRQPHRSCCQFPPDSHTLRRQRYLKARINPTPPAAHIARTTSVQVLSRSSSNVTITPGRTPAEPAVGAAQHTLPAVHLHRQEHAHALHEFLLRSIYLFSLLEYFMCSR